MIELNYKVELSQLETKELVAGSFWYIKTMPSAVHKLISIPLQRNDGPVKWKWVLVHITSSTSQTPVNMTASYGLHDSPQEAFGRDFNEFLPFNGTLEISQKL